MTLPMIADFLNAQDLLVHCAECAEPLPTFRGDPVGASVTLGTGEKLFWCSPECLTRTTTRVRIGGDVCVVCATVLCVEEEPRCEECESRYQDGERYSEGPD
jgi:hypothetical protein